MQNIGDAFKQPLKSLATQIADLSTPESRQLSSRADSLVRLVDEIQLANMLENDIWKGTLRSSPSVT